VVLDKGRVVERGAHQELMAGDTLYASMFGRAEREGCEFDALGLEEPAAAGGGGGGA
jgi:hypothetical protein